MIQELLKKGKSNALSIKQLMLSTGISSEREFRRVLAEERESGSVILSTKQGGYYLPGCKEEIQEYIREKEKSIASLRKAIEPAKRALEDLQIDGQISFPLEDLQDSKQDPEEEKRKQSEISDRLKGIRERWGMN